MQAVNGVFGILEHKLPERLGLSISEIVLRRRDLEPGTDWVRQGRWIKYSDAGLQKLIAKVAVPSAALNPEPPGPQLKSVEVHRMSFPNQHIIECREFDTDNLYHVRIKPEWRPMYRPRMKIEILLHANNRVATTRRPRGVFRF
jgi:hypothetical protein